MKIPDFDKMDRDEITDWIAEQRSRLSEKSFQQLKEVCGEDVEKRTEELDGLEEEVRKLYNELNDLDMGLAEYFDIESDKMLDKKARVLRELYNGKDPYEIGKDYLDILEKYDPDKNKGKVEKLEGWEFDPSKFK